MKTNCVTYLSILFLSLMSFSSCGQPEIGLESYEKLIEQEVKRGDNLPDAIQHIRKLDLSEKGPLSVRPVLPYLKDHNPEIRKNALRLIRTLKNREDACQEVLRAAGAEKNSYRLIEMIDFLTASRYREAIPYISQLLTTENYAHVTLAALQYFARVKDPAIVPVLLEYTAHDNMLLIIPAIAAISNNFSEPAAVRLKEMIKDVEYSKQIRFKALNALNGQNNPEYCSLLTDLLRPQNEALMLEYIANSATCNRQEIEDHFIAVYDSSEYQMQQWEAAYILQQIVSEKYFKRILEDYLADSGNKDLKRFLLRFYHDHYAKTLENIRYTIEPELQNQILTKVRSGLKDNDWISWEIPFEDMTEIKILKNMVWVEAEMVKDKGTMKHYNFLMLLDENKRIEYSELISGGMGCGIFQVPNR